MRSRLKRKLYSKKGFTLAETLLAVLILLMVSAIVAEGIPVAQDAYQKVVLASNADALLSTTITSLRNELGMAQEVDAPENEGNTEITYYNSIRGATSKIYLSSDDKKEIMLQRYYSADNIVKSSEGTRLVSAKASSSELYVTYTSVAYNEGIVTFSGLQVKRISTDDKYMDPRDLSIRVIAGQGE